MKCPVCQKDKNIREFFLRSGKNKFKKHKCCSDCEMKKISNKIIQIIWRIISTK